ncbi:hypothetical protein R1flu_029129 [Riccia fluitans]|uniref:Uncharacterized protein n=1 Tax=Riccia fluitans TaxID=41844 RepID=A0ABD1XRN0_9MARC
MPSASFGNRPRCDGKCWCKRCRNRLTPGCWHRSRVSWGILVEFGRGVCMGNIRLTDGEGAKNIRRGNGVALPGKGVMD